MAYVVISRQVRIEPKSTGSVVTHVTQSLYIKFWASRPEHRAAFSNGRYEFVDRGHRSIVEIGT